MTVSIDKLNAEEMDKLCRLEKKIGYAFQDRNYLLRALTHSSYANEQGMPKHHLYCNERLEFLGDSVLSLVTSEYLFLRFPELPEGDLTRIRASLVCEEALASFSETLNLGSFLFLGKGECQTGGAQKPAVIADAFESILAAIYLDSGAGGDGLGTVKKFLLPFLENAVKTLPISGGYRSDCKSRLQEFIQKQDHGQIEYRLLKESGPDHNKEFEMGVYLDSNCIGKGTGHSKKQAEQAAAKDALALFGEKD